jgi:hypothetical protein
MPLTSALSALPAVLFVNNVQQFLGTEWCTLIYLTQRSCNIDFDEFVRRKQHEALLLDWFPPCIRDLFGGTAVMQTYPRQQWELRFLGSTDYVTA